jgi:hypothetical protein
MLATTDFAERSYEIAFEAATLDEPRRRPRDTRAGTAEDVPLNPLADLAGAPLRVEPFEVETEALGTLPEMRIIDPAAVGVKRIAHLPERALQPGRLSRRMEGRRSGMRGSHGKMPEAQSQRQLPDSSPARRAIGTSEVQVEDHLPSLSRDMVIRPDRRDRGAGQLAHPSKLAPGMRVATPGRSTRRR